MLRATSFSVLVPFIHPIPLGLLHHEPPNLPSVQESVAESSPHVFRGKLYAFLPRFLGTRGPHTQPKQPPTASECLCVCRFEPPCRSTVPYLRRYLVTVLIYGHHWVADGASTPETSLARPPMLTSLLSVDRLQEPSRNEWCGVTRKGRNWRS
ncbi:hypothetical protein EDB81DRAFT_162451 [Dactylonectria macrodidyma]|uniref:Uncharacterized protein n=1 Tax=Dactylonectria macrodidyma TaxID=307937 RepID=A0A9P9JLC3_9HYPO|nr:hypothetical protein EDB81DRAFT_162451 [Dactylonectria macrodidyma]